MVPCNCPKFPMARQTKEHHLFHDWTCDHHHYGLSPSYNRERERERERERGRERGREIEKRVREGEREVSEKHKKEVKAHFF